MLCLFLALTGHALAALHRCDWLQAATLTSSMSADLIAQLRPRLLIRPLPFMNRSQHGLQHNTTHTALETSSSINSQWAPGCLTAFQIANLTMFSALKGNDSCVLAWEGCHLHPLPFTEDGGNNSVIARALQRNPLRILSFHRGIMKTKLPATERHTDNKKKKNTCKYQHCQECCVSRPGTVPCFWVEGCLCSCLCGCW